MRLRSKIALLSIFIAFSFLAIAMISLQVLKSASEQDNFARIEQLFKSAYSTISELENMAEAGQLSEQQAKSIATQLLRENKYHPSEYVYITDDELTFIAAPHDPQLHGTSFNDFKDATGNSIGAIVARVTASQPGKMVTYDWTSERDGEVVGLKSVAQQSNVWNWYIGTGISFKETDERYWSTAKWLLSASIILVVAITFITVKFGQNLTASLGAEVKQVVAIVAKVSKGDLSEATAEQIYDRESVMGSLSYMKHALKIVVSEIQTVSDTLSAQVIESEQQSAELETFVSSLDTDTHAASDSINEIANGLQHTTEAIDSSASGLADAEQKGTQANDMTQKSSSAIGELESNIQSAGQSVQQLASEVQQIENVLTVIQGVAEQTNLLALNAAIEAARAGEQGRGFAVVADEVRQLAHRTQQSTQEIQAMIERLQQAAQNALLSVNSSVEKSAVVVDRSAEASKAIEELLSIVSSVAGTSQSILSASQQQLSETAVVSERLTAISNMAQETNHVAKHAQESSKLILDCSASLKTETEKFVI